MAEKDQHLPNRAHRTQIYRLARLPIFGMNDGNTGLGTTAALCPVVSFPIDAAVKVASGILASFGCSQEALVRLVN